MVNTGDTVFRVDPPPAGQAVGQVDHGARAFLATGTPIDVAHQGLLLAAWLLAYALNVR